VNHRILSLFFISILFLEIVAKNPVETELQPMTQSSHKTFNEDDHPYYQMHAEEAFPAITRSTILYSRTPAPGYGLYILFKACFGCTEPDEVPLVPNNDNL
jgi:hypothetical protein